MTVHTPFPDRPATPYWSPRGKWGGGMGEFDPSQITGDITDVFRTVYSVQPGMYTVQNADGSVVTYRQPEGNLSNLPVGNVSGAFNTGVQGTVSTGSGVWILLGVGALIFFFSRGKH